MKNGGSFHSYVSLPEGTYNYVVFFDVYATNVVASWSRAGEQGS